MIVARRAPVCRAHDPDDRRLADAVHRPRLRDIVRSQPVPACCSRSHRRPAPRPPTATGPNAQGYKLFNNVRWFLPDERPPRALLHRPGRRREDRRSPRRRTRSTPRSPPGPTSRPRRSCMESAGTATADARTASATAPARSSSTTRSTRSPIPPAAAASSRSAATARAAPRSPSNGVHVPRDRRGRHHLQQRLDELLVLERDQPRRGRDPRDRPHDRPRALDRLERDDVLVRALRRPRRGSHRRRPRRRELPLSRRRHARADAGADADRHRRRPARRRRRRRHRRARQLPRRHQRPSRRTSTATASATSATTARRSPIPISSRPTPAACS